MKTILTLISLTFCVTPLAASPQDCQDNCNGSFGTDACWIYSENYNACDSFCNDHTIPWWKKNPKGTKQPCVNDCGNICNCCDD